MLSPYLLSIPQQIQAVVARRVQILRGNMFFTGMNLLYVLHLETLSYLNSLAFIAPSSSKLSLWEASS